MPTLLPHGKMNIKGKFSRDVSVRKEEYSMMKLILTVASLLVWLAEVPTTQAVISFSPDQRMEQPQIYGPSGNEARNVALWLLDFVQRNEHAYNKRNSEIINSLLGLPKVLNDAGR